MGKRLSIPILVILISVVAIASGSRAGKSRQTLLRDGFALTGVDGKLAVHDSNKDRREFAFDRWFFEFDSDVSDGRGLIKAGARLELLPSSALEKMIADANNSSVASYRLGGRVTQYRRKNFIFPTYFLRLVNTKTPHFSKSEESAKQEKQPTINEPNDVLTIPKELIEKLPDRKKRIDLRKTAGLGEEIRSKLTEVGGIRKTDPKQDFILSDRTAIFRDIGRGAEGTWREVSFALDAVGRTESKISLRLLPCQVLEQAQQRQSASPDLLRFKIAGIVTKYKGKQYLLLQRATRVFSHGNFPR
jgi:hypothetical protein